MEKSLSREDFTKFMLIQRDNDTLIGVLERLGPQMTQREFELIKSYVVDIEHMIDGDEPEKPEEKTPNEYPE